MRYIYLVLWLQPPSCLSDTVLDVVYIRMLRCLLIYDSDVRLLRENRSRATLNPLALRMSYVRSEQNERKQPCKVNNRPKLLTVDS